MHWHELTELPFAAALTQHHGGLALAEVYDSVHFDLADFEEPNASASRFLECAFTGVSFRGGQLRGSRFSDVWMGDVQLTATGLAETQWLDATVIAGAVAGVEAFGARLRRVVLRGCKLGSVNFRDSVLTEARRDCGMGQGAERADGGVPRRGPGARGHPGAPRPAVGLSQVRGAL